ncbi:MAG: precorrin-8X methylmutase, partial [Pseudomonadota bacterium]
QIGTRLADAVASGARVLAGFDFPFGYPAGFARRLGGDWRTLWARIEEGLEDAPDNTNNRFDLAGRFNAAWEGEGPLWANGLKRDIAGLPRTRPDGFNDTLPAQWRATERVAKKGAGAGMTQECWKLAGAGSVGGQVLTGIAALERLRHDPALGPHIRLWPFETGLARPESGVTLAEIYPSLIPVSPAEGEVKDAAQVRCTASRFAELDGAGLLPRLFAGPSDLPCATRDRAVREEAWILGAGFEGLLRDGPPATPRLRYERDPARIYRQSFETVRAESRLDHLPADLRPVAIRLVHACGMPDITARLAWSSDVGGATAQALADGAPILCDCEAVAAMVVRGRLPGKNEVICTLNAPGTRGLAETLGTTRSAAGVEAWRERLAGALVAIGNAPTALFHLLEGLDQGWPRPAAILAFPVGFVGAAESKAELAARPRGVPFLTLRGRRGGSALAAAAVNGLAAGLETPQ